MSPLEAARLYGTVAARTGASGAGGTGTAPAFAEVLKRELEGAAAALHHGEAVARAGLLGRASVQEVVEAVTAAELALERVTAVRDRVIAAYQEILRMPI